MGIRRALQVLAVCGVAAACMQPFAFSAAAEDVDYVLQDGRPVAIPVSYAHKRTVSAFGENDGFNKPLDLFVDQNDQVYVADTGNNRIVQLDLSGNLVRVLTVPEERTPLNQPRNVFVTDNGHLYIADTGNKRVVHLNAAGEYVEEFGKPDSPLYDDSVFDFTPTAVIVDSLHYLNVLSDKDTHGILRFSPEGEFVGYLAANKVKTSFWTKALRFVLTEEQLAMLGQSNPLYYLNFCLDSAGFLYTTTAYAQSEQIKKLNTVGKNIYEPGVYAEIVSYVNLSGVDMNAVYGLLGDITVDSDGIISVVDSTKRYVYQYDPDGNMICRFGGQGEVKGSFQYPVSIGQSRNGDLLVLDRDHNNIQVFGQTRFSERVHAAMRAYGEGGYGEALRDAGEILETCATYRPAYILKGKILYKQEKWEESMALFKQAKAYDKYSDSFSEYRAVLYRKYFLLIVPGAAALITAAVLLAFRCSRKAVKFIYEEL